MKIYLKKTVLEAAHEAENLGEVEISAEVEVECRELGAVLVGALMLVV